MNLMMKEEQLIVWRQRTLTRLIISMVQTLSHPHPLLSLPAAERDHQLHANHDKDANVHVYLFFARRASESRCTEADFLLTQAGSVCSQNKWKSGGGCELHKT